MSKESIVEIPIGSGNKYRYAYSDGATKYLGPVGSAPPIDEESFLTMQISGESGTIVITKTKKGVIEMTPESYSSGLYRIRFESKENLSSRTIFKMFKKDHNVKRVRVEKDAMGGKGEFFKLGDAGEVLWNQTMRDEMAMFVKKDEWPAVANYIDEQMEW